MPDQVMLVVIDIYLYFRVLCSKVKNRESYEDEEKHRTNPLHDEYRTNYHYLPSFVTIMIHMSVHWVTRAKLAGPM